MRYFPQRARRNVDISLRVCSHCLGDVVWRSDSTGKYYLCLQCDERVEAPSQAEAIAARLNTQPGEFFPEPEPTLT
jgi:hypothetical protein